MRLKVLSGFMVLLMTISVAPLFNGYAEAVMYSGNGSGGSFLNGWYKPVNTNPWTRQPVQPKEPVPANQGTNKTTVQIMTAEEKTMLDMVNRARSVGGLKPLSLDPALTNLARLKGLDMISKNYFSHTSPTYGTFTAMLKNNGIKYELAAENLAGAPSAKTAFEALMASPQHKKNILNPQFTNIGIGAAGPSAKYGKIFVQIFTKKPAAPAPTQPAPAPAQPAPAPAQPAPAPTQPAPAPTQPAPAPTQPAPAPAQPAPAPAQPAPAPAQPAPAPAQPAPAPTQPAPIQDLTADEQKMFDLVNQERVKAGLQPLVIDMEVVKVARLKAKDMIEKNYFDHNSPTYGSPFDMMKQFGIKYSWAGENLAGAPNVDLAHTNLMNSPGHRANILRAQFTHVGIGVIDGGPYGKMFVQMFISK